MVKRIYIYMYEEAKQLTPKSKLPVSSETSKLSTVNSPSEWHLTWDFIDQQLLSTNFALVMFSLPSIMGLTLAIIHSSGSYSLLCAVMVCWSWILVEALQLPGQREPTGRVILTFYSTSCLFAPSGLTCQLSCNVTGFKQNLSLARWSMHCPS
jgi:hypothetical protein